MLSRGGSPVGLEKAELVIINSCGVKGPTENKILQRAANLLAAGHLLVIAGCLPRISPRQIAKTCPGLAALLDTRSIHLTGEMAKRVLAGEKGLVFFSDPKDALRKASLPVPRPDGTIGTVQISEGCGGHCSYCATKLARGALRSFPASEITATVTALVQTYHCREIRLTAQDTGSYCDDGLQLPGLVERVLEASAAWRFNIRLGMMNPDSLRPMVVEYTRLLQEQPAVYRFLHLPVQSGSDSILQAMGRQYTINEVKKVIGQLKEALPRLTVSTDIIVGFPGETEGDYQLTEEFIKWLQPDTVNVSRFWPRPRTKAAKEKRLPHKLVKSRTKRLIEINKQITAGRNKQWVGWQGEALVTKEGRNQTSVLRNAYYKPVIINGKLAIGKRVEVVVEGSTPYYLLGIAVP